jgi:iron-sulfur cluster repair protein YtfE (RIC family)
MEATLVVYPLSRTETQLELSGRYRPPLGVLGSAVDAAWGHRIAKASVLRFVQELAAQLTKELGPTLSAASIRAKLLDDHEQLRRLLGAAEELAARQRRQVEPVSELRDALAALRTRLMAHNSSEEALVEPLLAEGDDWAPKRIARMSEEHRAEHAAMVSLLDGDKLRLLAETLPELAEELRAHMEAEERTFLHPKVLAKDRP